MMMIFDNFLDLHARENLHQVDKEEEKNINTFCSIKESSMREGRMANTCEMGERELANCRISVNNESGDLTARL